jgi:hypothetical protein
MFSKTHEESGGVELASKPPGSKRHSYLRPENFFLACLITLLFVSIGSLSQAQDINPAYRQLRTVVPVDLSPSKPTSLPGTSGPQFGGEVEAIPISSALVRDWLPVIPNLQFGFNYLFGRNLSQAWWSADYVLPVSLTSSDIVFGEAHVDSASSASTGGFPFLNNFWQQGPAGLQNRIDLSFGLGYRKLLGDNLLVGAYGFYDSTRLTGSWRSAGSAGFQAAANGPGDSAVDLNFNYYSDSYVGYDSRGSDFPTFNFFGAISRGTGNYDFEAGVSQPLFNRAYDFRVKAAGYKYDIGNSKVYGLRSGADLTTADGVFKVSAEYGNDRLIGQYGQIGAYVNIGFQAENIVKGENPFTKPEPIFKSPRHLRQLASQPAKRNWRKPSAVITNPKCYGMPDDSQFQMPEDKACFWSGGRDVAMAKCTHEGYTVQTQTPGGAWVESYINSFPNSKTSTDAEYTRDFEPMWICASAASARMAEGTVRVYLNKPRANSVFYTTELPILQGNSNVKHILASTSNDDGANWSDPVDLK